MVFLYPGGSGRDYGTDDGDYVEVTEAQGKHMGEAGGDWLGGYVFYGDDDSVLVVTDEFGRKLVSLDVVSDFSLPGKKCLLFFYNLAANYYY